MRYITEVIPMLAPRLSLFNWLMPDIVETFYMLTEVFVYWDEQCNQLIQTKIDLLNNDNIPFCVVS